MLNYQSFKFTEFYSFSHRQEGQVIVLILVFIMHYIDENFWQYRIWVRMILRPTRDARNGSTGNHQMNDDGRYRYSWIHPGY